MDLYDRVVEALDEYGILYGSVEVYDNGNTIHIVGVDESEWDDVVMAIEDLLGLEVEVPPEDHDELDNELIVRDITSDTDDDGAFSRGQGSYLLPKEVTFKASEVALDSDDEDPEERLSDLLSDRYGYCHFGFKYEVKNNENGEPSEFRCYDIEWDTSESLKEAEQDKELKWFVILGTKHSSSEVVEGFKTKEEALKALTKHLEEEPENIIFYTIRKEVPTKMFDYEW